MRAALAAALVAVLAAAPDPESCLADGSGPGCSGDGEISADDTKCVRWRQTGGCSPRGPREKHGDKSCHEEIPPGSSGYCQCGAGAGKRRAREVTCNHRPFRCATECLQIRRYLCVSWRQTGDCSADGKREPHMDKSCDSIISPRMSGFCECGDGRIIRKPGCDRGDVLEPFRCQDECAGEPDLYEELGLDSSASEKAIKQAFRKLSLKYHPDKTRNDPTLGARFAAIREAYDIIDDAEQRAIYDASGLQMVLEAKNQKVEKGPAMNGEVTVSLEGMYNGNEFTTSIQRKVICRGCADQNTDRCRKCTARCANEVQFVNVQMGPMVIKQQQEVASKEKCRMESTPLVVTVERGSSAGDSVLFKSMGEQRPKKIPGDVVLKFKELKHKAFRRVGVDLHAEVTISLREALLGFERTLVHLDKRNIMVTVTGVTKPFGVLKVDGEGMPFKGDPTQHGNLFVKCTIAMPEDGTQWLRENALPVPA